MTSVIDEIAAERQRQIAQEGWDTGHDDEHDEAQLLKAAAAYLVNALHYTVSEDTRGTCKPPQYWPWDDLAWKPKNMRRDLVRAAALLVAELERLDRATATS